MVVPHPDVPAQRIRRPRAAIAPALAPQRESRRIAGIPDAGMRSESVRSLRTDLAAAIAEACAVGGERLDCAGTRATPGL